MVAEREYVWGTAGPCLELRESEEEVAVRGVSESMGSAVTEKVDCVDDAEVGGVSKEGIEGRVGVAVMTERGGRYTAGLCDLFAGFCVEDCCLADVEGMLGSFTPSEV